MYVVDTPTLGGEGISILDPSLAGLFYEITDFSKADAFFAIFFRWIPLVEGGRVMEALFIPNTTVKSQESSGQNPFS